MLDNYYQNEKIQVPFNHYKPQVSSIKRSHFISSQANLAPPEPISSVLAASWQPGHEGLDVRPRLKGALPGDPCLVDTGSAITAIKAGPDDKVDPKLALLAANGSLIECCGYKEVSFKLVRKTYKMMATVAKIDDNIIGWDFIKKFKMNFIWEGEECFFYDKKAKISWQPK